MKFNFLRWFTKLLGIVVPKLPGFEIFITCLFFPATTPQANTNNKRP